MQMDAVFKARDVYTAWHSELFASEKLLPAPQQKIKMFCADLAELGYSFHTIVNVYLNGLCCWVCVMLYSSSRTRVLYFNFLIIFFSKTKIISIIRQTYSNKDK